jgi:hypothetical protein
MRKNPSKKEIKNMLTEALNRDTGTEGPPKEKNI